MNKPPKRIVGIAGTDGSGKDTVGEMLAEHGWLFVSVTDILRAEARKRKLPVKRKFLRQISAEWRREQGLGVLIDKAIKKFKTGGGNSKYKGLAASSLRNSGEADRVHELGGQVVWVDADPKVRYERIVARNRGTEDQVTFDEFIAEEHVQMQRSGDEATLSLSEVKTKADIFLANNGHSLKAFKTEAAKALVGPS